MGTGEIENDDDKGRPLGNGDSRFAVGDSLSSDRDRHAALTTSFAFTKIKNQNEQAKGSDSIASSL